MGNLRKTPTVLFTLLLCWSVQSFSEDVTYLELDCQIKDQSVLGVVDGQPKKYRGVEDSYGVGEFLKVLMVSIDGDNPPTTLAYQLKWGENGKTFGFFDIDDLELHDDKKGGVVPRKIAYLYFKEDIINIEDDYHSTDINLRRYYKSDFDGFIVVGPTYGTQHVIEVNSVDCRTKTNNLMDLLPYAKR